MNIVEYLPQKMRSEVQKYIDGDLEEIRVRAGKPVQYIFCDGSKTGMMAEMEDIEEMINYLSDYSFHAISRQLTVGFFTVEGGHRVGIAGMTEGQGRNIASVSDIASLNIRIARQIKGVADMVIPWIRNDRRIYNTFIVSKPGDGKTTCLRDCIRILSDGADGLKKLKVAVVDERSEIGACYKGMAQNDLGVSCDVMDNCPKSVGMKMLLRSMSPEVIAVDELGSRSDFEAVEEITNCGVNILGTIHGSSCDDIMQKKIPKKIERIIFIEKTCQGKRRYSVYDKNFRMLDNFIWSSRSDKLVEPQKAI